MTNTMRRAAIFCLPLLLLAAGCSQLGAFNAVMPKDGGAARIARDIAYGPGQRRLLDVYAPSPARTDAPVVVFFYGGSWSSGDKDDYGFAARALASRGFVTVVFDYRLVPGIRYPVFVQDSAKAVAWAYRHAANYGGDARRLFVVGHSAGAYNAAMVALAPEFLGAEGLSPRIVKAAVGLSGPYDFLPLDVDETREAFKGVVDLKSTQPINRVTGGAPPMLLISGDADTTVYPRNTKALAGALKRRGVPVETRYYPGQGHAGTLLALARPLRGRTPVLDDLVDFLSRY